MRTPPHSAGKKHLARALLAAVLLAAGGEAPAQAVSQRAAALLDVIIENGCTLTRDDAARILPPLGYGRRETARLSRELTAAGMVVMAGQALVAEDGLCPVAPAMRRPETPAAAPDASAPLTGMQERYISILRHNGCRLRTGEAERLFPKYGMDMGLASELEEGLVDGGIAVIADAALQIGPDYCLPDEAFTGNPALSADAQHLIEILETGSCTLVQSEIAISFPQDGMPPEVAAAAVASLLASGGALAVRGGDRIWLSPALCRPWSERNG